MGICSLGVSEDGIWQPNKSDHIAVQSQFFHCAVVSETAVCPRLGKDDVNLVFLKENHQKKLTCWVEYVKLTYSAVVRFDANSLQKHTKYHQCCEKRSSTCCLLLKSIDFLSDTIWKNYGFQQHISVCHHSSPSLAGAFIILLFLLAGMLSTALACHLSPCLTITFTIVLTANSPRLQCICLWFYAPVGTSTAA